MSKLTHNLSVAWSQRAMAALDVLANAAVAPALFKPETVQEAAQDANKARATLGRLENLDGAL
jgi:hypothetical protein